MKNGGAFHQVGDLFGISLRGVEKADAFAQLILVKRVAGIERPVAGAFQPLLDSSHCGTMATPAFGWREKKEDMEVPFRECGAGHRARR